MRTIPKMTMALALGAMLLQVYAQTNANGRAVGSGNGQLPRDNAFASSPLVSDKTPVGPKSRLSKRGLLDTASSIQSGMMKSMAVVEATPGGLWEIDASPPSPEQTVATPPALYGHKAVRMTQYGGRQWLLVHGGRTLDGSVYNRSLLMETNTTWRWSILSLNGTLPVPRYDHSLVASTAGNFAVMFGGTNGSVVFGGTFVLTASNSSLSWQQVTPECHPTLGCPQARYGHAAVMVENVCFPGEDCSLRTRKRFSILLLTASVPHGHLWRICGKRLCSQ
jgi:hypothetical protein